jgi:hypothetical protein
MASIAFKIENDAAIKILAHVDVHVKIGIFMKVIPSTCILITVAKKFTAVNSIPSPDICKAQI